MLTRRSVFLGMSASFPSLLACSPFVHAAGSLRFLDISKLKAWQTKVLAAPKLAYRGSLGNVRYADIGSGNGDALILYFHGISSPYRISMPLQYPLLEAGYRIVMPNRPGYSGTTDDWGTSAREIADMAKELLVHLKIREPVVVMGTSAGGAVALAFASAHASATKTLILNSAVSHTWTAARFVPLAGDLRERFEALDDKDAFKFATWVVEKWNDIFGDGIKVNFDEHIIGTRKEAKDSLKEARADAAYEMVKNIFSNPALQGETGRARMTDLYDLFLADEEFVADWRKIKAPTLLTHCRNDIVVSLDHATEAARKIKGAELATFDDVAGHITCLGRQAGEVHARIRAFLEAHK